ncbi:MAG: Band 7 protein [Parcubacteria group bacterium]|nr:Band 7 protein [Parcubacteria group bacterium]
MSRFRLIVGLILLTIIYFAWNYFHPEAGASIVQTQTINGLAYPISSAPADGAGHISRSWLLIAFGTWYALCFINIVDQRVRRPVMRFGKYVRTLDGGLSLLEPIVHTTLEDVNVQDIVIEVSVEDMQTKDNVGVSIKGILTYRIDKDRVKDAVVEVEDVDDSTHDRALSTLADVGATKELDNLLEHRDQFCADIQTKLNSRVSNWGVTIQAFELQEFSINDEEVEKAIAMKARAAKEGQAELVRAEMQVKIAEALNKAAATYNDAGKWLKGIETLLEMCRSGNNNTVLIPTDLTESLAAVRGVLPALK